MTLDYGQFLQATFDFLIIAFAIFLFIRLITKLTTKKQAEDVYKRQTVDAAYMLNDDIGYVKVSKFGRTSHVESVSYTHLL